jgi:hypothetical protein
MSTTSKRLTPVTLVIFTLTLGIPSDAISVVTPPITPCYIEVDDAHISTYLLRKEGTRAVKVNARSVCNQPMRKLKLTVEIYKERLFGDKLVAFDSVVVPTGIPGNKVIRNEKVSAKCLNSKESRYYGSAYATAVIGNKSLKTFKVRSEQTVTIRCGV